MGLFGYIAGKIQEAGAEAQEAQMEAERWDSRRICDVLQHTSSFTKCTGYAKALNAKAQEMSTSELKLTFDFAYNRRNTKACNALMPIMNREGLVDRDDNGKIYRNY